MAPCGNQDPIIRVESNLYAPTGESTTYVTKSGQRWRTSPYGELVGPGGSTGQLMGGGKFGPAYVRT